MGMTDGKHLDIEDQPARKSGRNLGDPDKLWADTEKKCIHKLGMKGHGKAWCVIFHKEANCGSCKIFPKYRQQVEDRCHRKGQPCHIHYVHTGGTLRDLVPKYANAPVFTKHHETVMLRSKAEKLKQIMDIYGGVTPYGKYIQKLKNNIKVAEERSRMQRMIRGWWKNDVTIAMQQRAAYTGYSKLEARLLARAGVTLLHDEFIIDTDRWVSPFTEGELVTHKGELARVIKITGPVIKIKLQVRRSSFNNHLDVMDWELEKRSVIKWVVKLVRKLWQVG